MVDRIGLGSQRYEADQGKIGRTGAPPKQNAFWVARPSTVTHWYQCILRLLMFPSEGKALYSLGAHVLAFTLAHVFAKHRQHCDGEYPIG